MMRGRPKKGFTSLDFRKHRDYADPLYSEWRSTIRKRDKYCCQMPYCSKVAQACHHIQKWVDYPTLRFDPINGICLCKEHHDEVKNKEEIYAPLFMQIVAKNTMEYKPVKRKTRRRKWTR